MPYALRQLAPFCPDLVIQCSVVGLVAPGTLLSCAHMHAPFMAAGRFYFGEGYMEIVLDIHAWAYLARRAFASYTPKLGSVVFENAFVVQVPSLCLLSVLQQLPQRTCGSGACEVCRWKLRKRHFDWALSKLLSARLMIAGQQRG